MYHITCKYVKVSEKEPRTKEWQTCFEHIRSSQTLSDINAAAGIVESDHWSSVSVRAYTSDQFGCQPIELVTKQCLSATHVMLLFSIVQL